MFIPSVPPPPLPPELMRWTIRTPSADDVDRMLGLSHAVERALLGTSVTTRTEIERDVATRSGEEDTARLLVEHEGELVATMWFARVHEDHFVGDAQIHPSVSREAGDRVMAWGLDWFERIARASDPLPERIQLGTWSYEADTERARRLRDNGYDDDRVFLRMSRELPAGEQFPSPPDGVVVRRAQIRADNPDFGDARLVHSVISQSFADHYNYQASPFERWFSHRVHEAGFDPTQWWVAELDGRPLGAMVMNNALADDAAGYVGYCGVLREARGRGLAKALLYEGFAASRDAGYTSVKLFVDADSPTGATRLYESIGMTRELVTLDWQKWLVPAAEAGRRDQLS